MIERRALCNPADLSCAEPVNRLHRGFGTVLAGDDEVDLGVEVAAKELVKSRRADGLAGGDEGVVGFVGESEGENSLLGQVGAVNTGERAAGGQKRSVPLCGGESHGRRCSETRGGGRGREKGEEKTRRTQE